MHFKQTESVLQTKNRSEPAKSRFSVALVHMNSMFDYLKYVSDEMCRLKTLLYFFLDLTYF